MHVCYAAWTRFGTVVSHDICGIMTALLELARDAVGWLFGLPVWVGGGFEGRGSWRVGRVWRDDGWYEPVGW